MKRLLGGAGAALGLKIATGFAIAALAATAAVAATEVALTGSINPTNWGKQVKEEVADCKAALAPGQHGIGQCVSSFARQHGDAVSDKHQESRTDKDKSKDTDKTKDKTKKAADKTKKAPDKTKKAPDKSQTSRAETSETLGRSR